MTLDGTARAVSPIDLHVGNRLRLARKAQGMSQVRLAERLGIAFQQLQKYEKGINRISASRLHLAALALDVPLSFFFPEPAQPATVEMSEPPQPPYIADTLAVMNTSEGQALTMAFCRISDPKVRRCVTQFVRSLAETLS